MNFRGGGSAYPASAMPASALRWRALPSCRLLLRAATGATKGNVNEIRRLVRVLTVPNAEDRKSAYRS